VKKFIEKRLDPSRPLLLAYSGGPDSKALLYGLLEAGFRPHLAHVDHGWREESRQEALALEKEAAQLNLPFHSIRLTQTPEKNLEEHGREARIGFFRSLFDQIPFQSLLLGHHADDLAETALKRIFEGANLPFLGGMTAVCTLNGMPVWRPLLGLRKKEILLFLEARSLQGIYDRTNDDPRFLRTRLRHTLIPELCTAFGKEIVSNLAILSERAYELKEYLDRKISSIRRKEGEWGSAFYLKDVERVEARHLLKGFIPSRALIEAVLDAERGVFSPNIYVQNGWVVIFYGVNSLSISVVKNLLRQFNIFLL
jgi:tRNA(Ile)-lysidine synthase